MAYITDNQNYSITTRLQRLLGLRYQLPRSIPLLPVIVANAPDTYSQKQVSVNFTGTAGDSVTLGVPNNSPRTEVYLTSIIGTATPGTMTTVVISATIDGSARTIAAFRIDTPQENFAITFQYPIKIDSTAGNITLSFGTITSSNITFHGYQM